MDYGILNKFRDVGVIKPYVFGECISLPEWIVQHFQEAPKHRIMELKHPEKGTIIAYKNA